jgi:hypothetical protein
MFKLIKIHFVIMLCLFSLVIKAQDPKVNEKKLIQFSGIVVTGDSLDPVPFANVVIKGTKKGAVSDYSGFFSFVAEVGDVIEFSALGYKPAIYKVPDSLKLSRYSWIQVLNTDTIYMSETVIMPWPTVDQFKKTFVTSAIPNDDMQRAQKNLDLAEMKERAMNIPMDGSMNFKNLVDQHVYQNYYKGQYMPNNLLNPIAWVQFIKAWKEGKFKRDKK